MGSWDIGLYDDDTAADLRNTIRLLAKLPVSGDRLLEILVANHPEDVGLDDDGGPTFWLVVADQFERRGIACARVFERALAAIETGADLRDLEDRGARAGDLKRRSKMLKKLAERLRSPRPQRPRPKATKPPAFVVDVGEVYAFPTMKRQGFNAWHATWEEAGFKPDGWGAMLVVARGRVFDWLPWCAISSLSVPSTRQATLEDAARARLYHRDGAALCVPRRSHLRRMGMRLLGRLNLDLKKAAAVVSREHTPEFAVTVGWSFVGKTMAWNENFAPEEVRRNGGVPVAGLLV